MRRTRALLCVSAVLMTAYSGPIVAQDVFESDPASVSSDVDESAAPPVRHSGSIAYRTGGVGKEERDALLVTTKKYGLKVVFAAKKQDDFVAEVAVDIFDASGKKILSAEDTGPLFFADVPTGTFRVVATFRGQTQGRKVTVTKGKQAQISFSW
jgi:hypothetical protein